MRYISIEEAEPGMLLAKGVYDAYSRVLVAKKRPLTKDYILKLKERGYLGFYIEDEFSDGIEVEDPDVPLAEPEVEIEEEEVPMADAPETGSFTGLWLAIAVAAAAGLAAVVLTGKKKEN